MDKYPPLWFILRTGFLVSGRIVLWTLNSAGLSVPSQFMGTLFTSVWFLVTPWGERGEEKIENLQVYDVVFER